MARPASRSRPDEYWNHNTHYHGLVLASVPRGCGEALDVGCGDGFLARKLAARAVHVTGIDKSADMVEEARRQSEGVPNVDFVEADLLSYDLKPESYDFVCSVASIHHMDFAAAVTAMRDALSPGGSLIIISLAKDDGLKDRLVGVGGLGAHHFHRLRNLRRAGHPAAPTLDPDMTWAEVRAEAQQLLPGAVFRRHMLWRYSIAWRKPRT
ncbi:class I SAM-dependent methyltransferase [Actinomadura barringtoniae]|uniref:Class I SAM-dependent methyltransferase n=1 Tax=Actinomadura barringtoniae TaxID=1427535 RepID=A0A939PB60_9ACTN|nr:class I SAM-dependent methyltransferase [Actinomadura barringtoniae]MBO2449385.1 class I SAM-dependent methyltransferase [Actinomadura barringtoniae]